MSVSILLGLSFLVTALLYAMVGFGGGSTYAALLTFVDTDYRVLPLIVLTCNLVVVTGGTLLFAKRGLLNWSLALPLTLFSIPMAALGGAIAISRELFSVMLGLSLLVSALALLFESVFESASSPDSELRPRNPWLLGPLIGTPLGLLAGIVGIGGGIFLAPVLHHLKVASAKTIAATASFFIMVNSLAGLAGQLSKHSAATLPWATLQQAGWLMLAVLIGGQIGSRLSYNRLSNTLVKRLTALLVFYVGIRLLLTEVSS